MRLRRVGVALVLVALMSPSAGWAEGRPSWVDHPPQSADVVYIVGTSAPTINEQIGRRASLQDGLKQLAESFGVTASVYFQGDAQRGAREVSDSLIARSERVEIEGLSVDSIYVSDEKGLKTVYSLLKLSRGAYDREKRRLADEAESMTDMPTAIQRATAAISRERPGQGVALYVGPTRTDWPVGEHDSLADTIREAIAAEFARAGAWRVATHDGPDTLVVMPSLSLTNHQAVALTLVVTEGGFVKAASPAFTLDPARLPVGLQREVEQRIRAAALGLRAVDDVPTVFTIGIVGTNKNQYERIYQTLVGCADMREVKRTYYREGFGRFEVTVAGGQAASRTLCEVLEANGLAMIDRHEANYVFRQL